jgi:hypothetical protein
VRNALAQAIIFEQFPGSPDQFLHLMQEWPRLPFPDYLEFLLHRQSLKKRVGNLKLYYQI